MLDDTYNAIVVICIAWQYIHIFSHMGVRNSPTKECLSYQNADHMVSI